MARYELSDEHYLLIEPFLPINDGKVGHPYDPHRPILNGIFWRLHAGAAWPDIPERYGKQCVGWLKACRAVATRYEKLALNYLGLIKLAFIERYLRLLTRAVVPT